MEKSILRKALEPHLPPEIVWREKRGLRSPEPSWEPDGEKPPGFAQELLRESVLKQKGYFDPKAVQASLNGGRRARRSIPHVLALHLWDEMFVQGRRFENMYWDP